MTRRDFVGRLGAGVLALGAAGNLARAQAGPKVGIARSEDVLVDGAVRPYTVGEMIDRAVMFMTGAASADAAWSGLFSADEVVGIKPNGLGGYGCSTDPAVITHCIQRLHGVGVRPESILLWEDRPNNLDACSLSVDEPLLGARSYLIQSDLTEPITHGSLTDRFFAPLVNEVDAVLNLPILKAHPICGVTLAMKNHYGSLADPSAQHFDRCNTPMVDLADMPSIRDKTRLVVCDGTRARIQGQAYGEPEYYPNVVMAATDPVAHDTVGYHIIEDERERRGIAPLKGSDLEPRYIAMAAERGLGVADLESIDYEVIDLA
jgi:uncharacterized protein (DUF362 family)